MTKMLTKAQIVDKFWQMALDGTPEERRVAYQWRREAEQEFARVNGLEARPIGVEVA